MRNSFSNTKSSYFFNIRNLFSYTSTCIRNSFSNIFSNIKNDFLVLQNTYFLSTLACHGLRVLLFYLSGADVVCYFSSWKIELSGERQWEETMYCRTGYLHIPSSNLLCPLKPKKMCIDCLNESKTTKFTFPGCCHFLMTVIYTYTCHGHQLLHSELKSSPME